MVGCSNFHDSGQLSTNGTTYKAIQNKLRVPESCLALAEGNTVVGAEVAPAGTTTVNGSRHCSSIGEACGSGGWDVVDDQIVSGRRQHTGYHRC